ncbi:MAG TPA: transcriptional regulator, partial [Candidatus Saccharimonadales bacterium]|nr:transcriptional regulator [Candidatus Saccharimonadales bacterium]
MSSPTKYFYRFGDFTIDADQRVLLHEGKPIALTPKVFDTLLVLVENSGRIVTKEELMNRLWPDTFVEEANLAYNIQQLRKTFGDNARNPLYIKTIARRGYRFIASVDEVFDDTHTAGGQITRQYETSDARSPDAGNGLNRQVEAQMPEPDAELANESHSAASEKSFD